MLTTFFKQYDISHTLAGRCMQHLKEATAREQMRLHPEQVEALKNFPKTLIEDIFLEAFMPTLCGHPVFAVNFSSDKVASKMICTDAVKVVRLIKEEELLEPLQGMSFVVTGSVGYFCLKPYHSEQDLCATVVKGQWYCEATLWCHIRWLEGRFYAQESGCEQIVVLADVFQMIALKTRFLIGILSAYAKLFVDRFNIAIDEDTPPTEILFNDPFVLRGLMVQVINDRQILPGMDRTASEISQCTSNLSHSGSQKATSSQQSVISFSAYIAKIPSLRQ